MQVFTVLLTFLLSQTIDQSNARIFERSVEPSSGLEKYAVLCDAGSSGTRVKVYKYFLGVHNPIEVSDIVELEVPNPYKVKPGLSSFGDSTGDIGGYLDDLIDSAKKVVPADQQALTPIFLFATAGMRLLDEDKKKAILDEVNRLFSNKKFCPFYFKTGFAKIISGQEEAFYGWITVNFLKGIFSKKQACGTYGALDLGGASTQNTFRVKGKSKRVTFKQTLAGKIYPVYAHSYLSYGVDQARESYFKYLVAKQGSLKSEIVSPCHNDGYKDTIKIDDKDYTVIGKYDAVACKEAIKNKIFCSDPSIKKCPFVYQPKLTGNFYGFSAIYFALRDVGLLKEEDQIVTLAQIKLSTDTFCSKPAKDLDTTMFEVYGLCFQLNYIYELLKDGYNIDENSFTLHVAKDLHGFKLNWTLGAMLKATKLL